MIKKLVSLISFMLCVTFMVVQVSAFDLTFSDGTLAVAPVRGTGEPISGIELGLWRVADAAWSDGTMLHKLTYTFNGLENDLLDGLYELSATELRALIENVHAHIISNDIDPQRQGVTGVNGRYTFTGLEAGLYFVTQVGEVEYIMSSVLVPVPQFREINGVWIWSANAEAHPKTSPPAEPPTPEPPTPGPLSPEPPDPTDPGNNLVPRPDGNGYIEIDEDEVPLGEWIYDPEEEIWIFEESPPLANLPQTGVLRWPIPVLSALGSITTLSGLFIIMKEKKKNEH